MEPIQFVFSVFQKLINSLKSVNTTLGISWWKLLCAFVALGMLFELFVNYLRGTPMQRKSVGDDINKKKE